MQVFNTMNTVGISSNALFENSANNFFEQITFLLMQNFYQHSIFSANCHFLFLPKLRKRLTLTSILAGRK